MPKLKIYFDTSVLNFYCADVSLEKRNITRELFKEIEKEKFKAYISTVVIDEISKAKNELREKLTRLIKEYDFEIIEFGIKEREVGIAYVNQKIIPEKFKEDAYHISSAVLNNLDVIVSWNFAHIVKHKTRMMVNAVSKKLGLKEIDICTPEEVIEYED